MTISLFPERPRGSRRAFSLIEVVIALAVLAFACVSLIGMIPVAMINFTQAMNTSVDSQICQYLGNDILLANFSDLSNYVAQPYYFDNEGSPLGSGGAAPSGTIYTATVSTVPVSAATSPTAFTDPNSALNVTIKISCLSRPLQTNTFAFVVANNNR